MSDSHDLIRVQGARVNDLKDVSVAIPKRRLTVFTGVSGSGKSSLVFETAIIVDQEWMGANSRSTVGTATDANASPYRNVSRAWRTASMGSAVVASDGWRSGRRGGLENARGRRSPGKVGPSDG